MFKKLISFFFTLFFVINVANAQVTTSGMSGTVTDLNGEPLTGATVIAHYQPTGAQYGTVVDLKGNFRLYNINAGGPYTVTIQMLGYTTVKYENISVALADNYVVNVVLKEESIALDAIVVTGSSSSNMRSDRAGALTNLNVAAINNTPTISRSMNDLIRLTPQAHMSSNGANIGGGNYRQSFVTVDGAAFNNAFGIGQNLPASGSPVSLDALEQISINVTPYDVRQSGFTGASINAVTRS